jgi:hypothetical protein
MRKFTIWLGGFLSSYGDSILMIVLLIFIMYIVYRAMKEAQCDK